MNKKESVFISAVLYLSDFAIDAEHFTRNLLDALKSYFDHYEVIIVDDCSTKHKKYLDEDLPSFSDESTITVVHMSVKQGIEACLRAGLDVSIGDFVFEFDTLEIDFDKSLLWDVYQEALKGYDIVSVEPKQNSFSRNLFYKLFNKYSNADYDIGASAFRLVSRRAINRVLELNMSSAFRQAVYASCGLKNTKIEYKGSASSNKARGLSLAIDSFILYTEFSKYFCKTSIIVAFLLLFSGLIGAFVKSFSWLFNISILIGLILIILLLIALMYYGRLILKDKDTKYLISNIEKIQKG